MVDIRDFQHMPLSTMRKMFTSPGDVTVDINKIGEVLEVSVLPHDLSKYRLDGDGVMCAFVTNETGNSCVFYAEELYGESVREGRVFLMMTFARYITTCKKEFVITKHTQLTQWEKTLVDELLMPRESVKDVVNRLLIPTTYNLSEIFQVPQDFVKARLKDLKLPTMIAGYNY